MESTARCRHLKSLRLFRALKANQRALRLRCFLHAQRRKMPGQRAKRPMVELEYDLAIHLGPGERVFLALVSALE